MMPLLSPFFLLFLRPLFVAAASGRIIKSSVPGVPTGWRELRAASPEEPVFLRLALSMQDERSFEQKALAIATPGHPEYGRHLAVEELRAYTAPSKAAVTAVTEWVRQYSIHPQVDNYWVSFTTTVGNADQLLNATFAWYAEAGGGEKLRTLSYSVPAELSDYIRTIQPTTRFGQFGARRSTIFELTRLHPVENTASPGAHVDAEAANITDCGLRVTPTCLKSLYNISYAASPASNTLAFCSYLDEYARYADLESFVSTYVPAASGQNFSVVEVNGGLNDQTSKNDSSKWLD